MYEIHTLDSCTITSNTSKLRLTSPLNTSTQNIKNANVMRKKSASDTDTTREHVSLTPMFIIFQACQQDQTDCATVNQRSREVVEKNPSVPMKDQLLSSPNSRRLREKRFRIVTGFDPGDTSLLPITQKLAGCLERRCQLRGRWKQFVT